MFKFETFWNQHVCMCKLTYASLTSESCDKQLKQ